jgi:hypothetical protein
MLLTPRLELAPITLPVVEAVPAPATEAAPAPVVGLPVPPRIPDGAVTTFTTMCAFDEDAPVAKAPPAKAKPAPLPPKPVVKKTRRFYVPEE